MVTQLDLDGAGSPAALVTKILKAEPRLSIPVPIEELAMQLGIIEIKDMTTEGFEGGLIADKNKTSGYILVKSSPYKERRRFTIAHELAHFLIPMHRPVQEGKFLCKSSDMRQWSAKDQDAYIRMESEANQFAGLILVPPPHLMQIMKTYRDADLNHIPLIASHFAVSKEVAARAYAQYHNEPIAIVVVKDGVVKYANKGSRFPFLSAKFGQGVPHNTLFHRTVSAPGTCTNVCEVRAELWLEAEWGKRPPKLYEQVYMQQDGYALVMLWSDEVEDEEENDERTAKQRYRDRMHNER